MTPSSAPARSSLNHSRRRRLLYRFPRPKSGQRGAEVPVTGRSRLVPFPLLAVFLGTLALNGCDAQYPESMTYPLRSDPLVLVDLNGSGLSDQAEPDRPGQLPLLAIKGLFDPRNPMYPTRDDLFKTGYLR